MRKKTWISLKWDDNRGEGELKIAEGFENIHRVTQLDFLSDCIYDLQKLHDQIFFREVEDAGTSNVLEALGITKQLTDTEDKE
jgi:hypothetical protein